MITDPETERVWLTRHEWRELRRRAARQGQALNRPPRTRSEYEVARLAGIPGPPEMQLLEAVFGREERLRLEEELKPE